ncbi:hypothetical protein SHI21_04615 [Bacteriovorax sp. PP10]|uniref:Secreted protein n=1 Tax=Bacteriovorax antarcticus TaxID=3088717 RepID=A0ABU5VQY6_9BACT|nr:hypothetical protein [Bacteriovorax sp. PP10]MEA9355466.1 hypothetical protein [Bacteriovorax sp. PP10]
MKVTLLALVVIFSTSIFADTKMTHKDCRDLAVSTGVTPFLKENNIELFKVHELDKGSDSSKYFAGVMNGLLGNLTELCKKNENTFTIEEFTRKHFAACTSLCSDGVSTFNGKQAKKKDALDVCNSLCKKGFDQLQTLQQGARMGKAANEKSAQDCSGAISDQSRSHFKALERDLELGGITHKAAIKTIGK